MVDYYDREEMSQSKLKLLLGDPKYFNTVEEPERYFEEKTHFLIGDGVDFQLTRGSENFEDKFHVSNVENKPSDTMKSILNQFFDKAIQQVGIENIDSIHSNQYQSMILDCCNTHGYQPRWKNSTRINKVLENYEYWEDLKVGYGKTILSAEEGALIDQIVMSFKSNEATAKYWQHASQVQNLYQVQIYFEYEGVSCKGMLDIVRVDHNAKTITPIDIKTMGDYTYNFPKALRKRRYDIQAAFYTKGLETWKDEHGITDYAIKPFKFLVDSTKDPGTPLVFTCDESLIKMGEFGRCETYYNLFDDSNRLVENTRNVSIKGFKDLINLYKYHTENGFGVRKEVKEKDSDLTIDWLGII